MAKKKNTTADKWYVVVYAYDKLVSVCHESDFNSKDKRVKKVSEHTEVEKAMTAHIKYAKEKKLTPQY